jgi:thioredoxin-dependent peroxiredoxin
MNLSTFFRRADPLPPGAAAPGVSAPDHEGRMVDFGAVYRRGPTLVYFYPKADTPGCTAQACSLRDAFADLTTTGLQILGVSADTPEGQQKFREKFRLPFPLIADRDGSVARAFGVSAVLGLSFRQSFLILDGRIAWTSPRAQTRGHAEEVRAALAKHLAPPGGNA